MSKFLAPPIYAHPFVAISEKVMIHRTSLNQTMHVPMQAVPEKLHRSCVLYNILRTFEQRYLAPPTCAQSQN